MHSVLDNWFHEHPNAKPRMHVTLAWFLLIVVNGHGVWFLRKDPYFSENYNTDIYTALVVVLIGLAGISHYRCIKADPGLLPKKEKPKKKIAKGEKTCERCFADRSNFEPRVHHCSLCGGCVFKMSHHCMWTYNCVGYYNKKYYLLFLFWTFAVI